MFLCGRDYATSREMTCSSMKPFMDEVAPQVLHLDPDRALAA